MDDIQIAADVPAVGEPDWFRIVEDVFFQAWKSAPPPPETAVSVIERYHGCDPLPDGSMRGFRVGVENGAFSFRVGVAPDEVATLTVDIDFDAVLALADLPLGPDFDALVAQLTTNGKFRPRGEFGAMAWTAPVHDAVYHRTHPHARGPGS